jgi:hypothetical protein
VGQLVFLPRFSCNTLTLITSPLKDTKNLARIPVRIGFQDDRNRSSHRSRISHKRLIKRNRLSNTSDTIAIARVCSGFSSDLKTTSPLTYHKEYLQPTSFLANIPTTCRKQNCFKSCTKTSGTKKTFALAKISSQSSPREKVLFCTIARNKRSARRSMSFWPVALTRISERRWASRWRGKVSI